MDLSKQIFAQLMYRTFYRSLNVNVNVMHFEYIEVAINDLFKTFKRRGKYKGNHLKVENFSL